MTWEIVKHKDGKVMISVTMDELQGIIPPEVDELIDEHNETVVIGKGELGEKIDMDSYFTETSTMTFNIDSKNIVFKDV